MVFVVIHDHAITDHSQTPLGAIILTERRIQIKEKYYMLLPFDFSNSSNYAASRNLVRSIQLVTGKL